VTRGDANGYRLERRVADFVIRESVVHRGERALLMLSGGADSMTLLALLPIVAGQLGLELEFAALHVDYAMRGAQSDRDRLIVERACAAAGVRLHLVRLRRKLTGGDFQARARDLRYRHARAVAAAEGYDVIVTAHNRDDQAETVLYRLTKYASPRGLAGMRPREGRLARPLLCLGAAEIRDYCRARDIEYGEDATNAQPVYARNAIRLEVLPRLAAINPRVVQTLAGAAAMAAAEAEVLPRHCASPRRHGAPTSPPWTWRRWPPSRRRYGRWCSTTWYAPPSVARRSWSAVLWKRCWPWRSAATTPAG
jgi:tRNA(Ile)-lysidine synthase